ncbi:hypothetical protein NPX13_g8214 [Xylaria arbuscula]|uniref:Uncharacterized protein n=1 Tax=Xylaria arbuscula TaxID=114810 RepID=A0A9W8N936_9PEZI|nr:hypothetical protein NPX13_g8214 [Xylaria arbuscula]
MLEWQKKGGGAGNPGVVRSSPASQASQSPCQKPMITAFCAIADNISKGMGADGLHGEHGTGIICQAANSVIVRSPPLGHSRISFDNGIDNGHQRRKDSAPWPVR